MGDIISHAPSISYVHEPFNVFDKHYGRPFRHWYEYISSDMDQDKQDEALAYIRSFYVLPHYLKKIRAVNRPGELLNFSKGLLDVIARKRPLLKDPLAFMSSEWLYENLHCDVVISIRHPAAFAASLKVKKTWDFDFNNLLDQPELLTTYLADYRENIKKFAANQPDIIRQSTLLWNIVYSMVNLFQIKYRRDWYFVKHEDLSIDPVNQFMALFKNLDLDFTTRVRKKLVESTQSSVTSTLKRNSKDNIKTWQDRLTPSEIEFIKQDTYSVWKKFYTEEDWE